jgi:acetyl-CoA synthetase
VFPCRCAAWHTWSCTSKYGYDLREQDVYWNAADPGWGYGLFYAIDADEPAPPGTLGRVAVDSTAPLFAFTGYYNEPARTAQRFTDDGRWYITGDVASRDQDGRIFFSGRDDDVIIMAGYRIGPFDVESVLAAHDDVAEAAVIGVPDALKGEVIEAYVVAREGTTPSKELTADLQRHVKSKLAAHAYPRRVHYVDALPKTPSGKIQRFILRRQRAAELTDTMSS